MISWDLSPSSATNTTARLTRIKVNTGQTFRRSADRSIRVTGQALAEGLAHHTLCRSVVRRPGLRQYVDSTIGGYSPSLTQPMLVGDPRNRYQELRFRMSEMNVAWFGYQS